MLKSVLAFLRDDLVERSVQGHDLNPGLRGIGIIPVPELLVQDILRAARPMGRQLSRLHCAAVPPLGLLAVPPPVRRQPP